MKPFGYSRAQDANDALTRGAIAGVSFLGGGTNLVDLMREHIATPSELVDVSHLRNAIAPTLTGGLDIGSAATNTQIASHPIVRRDYPLLSHAILSGATGQIRNMATAAGNLMQRTRCPYFYDGTMRCNKRAPSTGCDAREGHNAGAAIFGASDSCVATHPSDMCVALAALEAVVHVKGLDGPYSIKLGDFHRLPGDTPHIDTTLPHGHLITSIELPPPRHAAVSLYRKVRERASYAFALIALAVQVEVDRGQITHARLALGGVAHKPWRDPRAERVLVGQRPHPNAFQACADVLLEGARPASHNAFKIDLVRRVLVHSLSDLTGAHS